MPHSDFVIACCDLQTVQLRVPYTSLRYQHRFMSQVAIFHSLAFWIGYQLAAWTVAKGPEGVPLARAISLQSGMQSSLLALLLSTRFFADPLVRLPCGISVTFMTLVRLCLQLGMNVL